MTRCETIIKLEAICYCLNGLIEDSSMTTKERGMLYMIECDIEKMLTKFERGTRV